VSIGLKGSASGFAVGARVSFRAAHSSPLRRQIGESVEQVRSTIACRFVSLRTRLSAIRRRHWFQPKRWRIAFLLAGQATAGRLEMANPHANEQPSSAGLLALLMFCPHTRLTASWVGRAPIVDSAMANVGSAAYQHLFSKASVPPVTRLIEIENDLYMDPTSRRRAWYCVKSFGTTRKNRTSAGKVLEHE